ncbi:MAG TPA: Ig-like domain repeat protein, partial [Nocardioides sp.]|nr:Ig-like domain repeat protein [Nocardioides sp.]
ASTSPARTQRVEAPVVPPTITPTPTPGLTPDIAPSPPPAANVSASTTTLRAPRKAPAGTRPTVTVTVARGAGHAAGTVVVTVGRWSRTVTLRAGTAKVRLPRLTGSRAKVTARYGGDAATSASTARRTITLTG